MRRAVAAKIFAVILCVFILVLIVQWIIMGRAFDSLYLKSMLSSYQEEFSAAMAGFSGGGEDSISPEIRQYVQETGSPVLAFSQHYALADRAFMSSFPSLTVRGAGGQTFKVPVTYLARLKEAPSLRNGLIFKLRAVQIGQTSYWEPLIIGFSTTYTNRDSMRRYRIEEATVTELDEYVTVSHVQYVLEGADSQAVLAGMVFEAMKDCLITRQGIDEYLLAVGEIALEDPYGNAYRLFSEKIDVQGTSYYLVTARKVLFSGREQSYVSQFFYILYAMLAVFLTAAAWALSRFVSRPLVQLNDELRQASLRAEANEQRMKTLIADLAHEFKTPLGIISSYAEVFEKGLYGDNPAMYFSVIDGEIDKLTEMVNEVIELSHLQTGSWRIALEPWDIGDIIASVLEGFSKRFESEGFKTQIAVDDLVVMADARRIEQVFKNFISNALKYSDHRRLISVLAREVGGRAVIEVGNSGSLSPDERQRIWDRYYQKGPEENVIARLPSEGIGLDIVRSILASHQSEYEVAEEHGMVIFRFTLEIYREPGGGTQ